MQFCLAVCVCDALRWLRNGIISNSKNKISNRKMNGTRTKRRRELERKCKKSKRLEATSAYTTNRTIFSTIDNPFLLFSIIFSPHFQFFIWVFLSSFDFWLLRISTFFFSWHVTMPWCTFSFNSQTKRNAAEAKWFRIFERFVKNENEQRKETA